MYKSLVILKLVSQIWSVWCKSTLGIWMQVAICWVVFGGLESEDCISVAQSLNQFYILPAYSWRCFKPVCWWQSSTQKFVKAPLKKTQQKPHKVLFFFFLTFLRSAAVIFLTQMWMNSYTNENCVNLDLAASSFYGTDTAISLGWFFCLFVGF